MRFLYGLLARFADARLTAEVERLREDLAATESKLRLASLEIDTLAAVLARNTKRIEAETAAAARDIARAGS